MTTAVFVVLYASALVFVVGTVLRALRYARAPLHLRWELYPVPHEAPGRAAHGGSYFEESDWWTKDGHFNVAGELRAMFTEMLFLKALREFNPRLWWRSFPFHVGLYLLIGTVCLLLVAALATLLAPALMAGAAGSLATWVCRAVGGAGLILTLAGALGLLARRLTDPDLKTYTTPGDIFNLAAFLMALGLLGAGYVLRPAGAPGILATTVGLLRWDTTVQVPAVFGAGLVLCGLLAAYIPFTHMSHFVGKYFTYHAVRWDDAANCRGGRFERALAVYLTYRPTWTAPHMTADGVRTWADVVTTNPTGGVKR
ncbi:MAG: respiratory nitrate reductase subunit gamma [Acidobacteriota bacterium]